MAENALDLQPATSGFSTQGLHLHMQFMHLRGYTPYILRNGTVLIVLMYCLGFIVAIYLSFKVCVPPTGVFMKV